MAAMELATFLERRGLQELVAVARHLGLPASMDLSLAGTELPEVLRQQGMLRIVPRLFHQIRRYRRFLERLALVSSHLELEPSGIPFMVFEDELDLIEAFFEEHRDLGLSASSIELPDVLRRVHSAVALCLDQGTLRAKAQGGVVDPQLLGNQGAPGRIAPHRWFALRRAEEAGHLSVEVDLPRERLALLWSIPGSLGQRLGSALADWTEGPGGSRLSTSIRARCDLLAAEEAVESAVRSYHMLLAGTVVEQWPVLGLYIGHREGRAGLTLMDKDGTVLATRFLKAWSPRSVGDAVRAMSPRVVIIPQRAAAIEALAAVVEELKPWMPMVRVREAGLSEARAHWMDAPSNLSREIASAAALAERVQNPRVAWRRVDAKHLGLLEYQEYIDGDLFAARIADEYELARRLAASAPRGVEVQPGAPAMNPELRSMADLKVGMKVTGIVTNITEFGAFVSLGIREEGLIHRSECADGYVGHPADVLRLGQRVHVRIISLEPERGRISLSLRDPMRPRPISQASRKSRALKGLDDLFKK